MRREQPLDLGVQAVGSGESQRRQEAEADRLAVAVAPIASRSLDCVTDRMAEVEHHPAPGIPLVRCDDLDLGPRAVEDHIGHACWVQVLHRPDP